MVKMSVEIRGFFFEDNRRMASSRSRINSAALERLSHPWEERPTHPGWFVGPHRLQFDLSEDALVLADPVSDDLASADLLSLVFSDGFEEPLVLAA